MITSNFFVRHRYLWLVLLGLALLLPYVSMRMFTPDNLVQLSTDHPLIARLNFYGFWAGAALIAYVGVKTHGGSSKL